MSDTGITQYVLGSETREFSEAKVSNAKSLWWSFILAKIFVV